MRDAWAGYSAAHIDHMLSELEYRERPERDRRAALHRAAAARRKKTKRGGKK